MDTEKKNLVKNSDYRPPWKDYSNTPVPGECVYSGMQVLGFDEHGSWIEPIQVNYIYKDKTLEVLERDFALKYPGPYKTFIEEQDRRLLNFIEKYTKNHEETK